MNVTTSGDVAGNCGSQGLVRASRSTTVQAALAPPAPITDDDDWLDALRDELDLPGEYLGYQGPAGDVVAFALRTDWTRIGRSLAADIRFDDPTVSRRHALIVRQPDGIRILDDRSMNGVFVNGERVEWSILADGDELVVGRHHLHVLTVLATPAIRDGQGTASALAEPS